MHEKIAGIINVIMLFIIMPIILIISIKIFRNQFYLSSTFILIAAVIPYLLKDKLKLVTPAHFITILVLSIIAILSRALFIYIPHFKPMTAIVIIASIACCKEAGLVVGVFSSFMSNFIFGQGAYSPWQMYAYGIAGFIAGLLYEKHVIKKDRLFLSIFGALLVIILVGPILDTCSIFMTPNIKLTANYISIYKSGFPVNLVHASATFLTILIISKPMFEKIARANKKYGLFKEYCL